jgi:hypothetical protein
MGNVTKKAKTATAKSKSALAARWGGSKEPVSAAHHETADNYIA